MDVKCVMCKMTSGNVVDYLWHSKKEGENLKSSIWDGFSHVGTRGNCIATLTIMSLLTGWRHKVVQYFFNFNFLKSIEMENRSILQHEHTVVLKWLIPEKT